MATIRPASAASADTPRPESAASEEACFSFGRLKTTYPKGPKSGPKQAPLATGFSQLQMGDSRKKPTNFGHPPLPPARHPPPPPAPPPEAPSRGAFVISPTKYISVGLATPSACRSLGPVWRPVPPVRECGRNVHARRALFVRSFRVVSVQGFLGLGFPASAFLGLGFLCLGFLASAFLFPVLVFLGLGFLASGFGVAGFRISGVGFLGFTVSGLVVSGFGIAGFRILGFTVSGFGVSGFGFWLQGFWVWGCRV